VGPFPRASLPDDDDGMQLGFWSRSRAEAFFYSTAIREVVSQGGDGEEWRSHVASTARNLTRPLLICSRSGAARSIEIGNIVYAEELDQEIGGGVVLAWSTAPQYGLI